MENYQNLDLTYIHKTLKDISNKDGSEFIPLIECCSSFQKINLTKSFNKREGEIKKIEMLENLIFIPSMPSRTNKVEYDYKNLNDWEYWCFEVKKDFFLNQYLANWFNTKLPKEQLIKLAPSGNYIKKINKKDINRIYVIKHSLEQQRTHNETLQVINKLKEKILKIENENSFDPKDLTIDTLISDIDELRVLKLINQDESLYYECKASFRLDVRTNKLENHITFSALKTIAAFLNSEGGIFVIGIYEDNKTGLKEIIGIEKENKNIDEWQRYVVDKIRDNIGKKFMDSYIKIDVKKYKNKSLAIIECLKLPIDEHATLKENNREEIFVRTANTTKKLDPGDIPDWIKSRK